MREEIQAPTNLLPAGGSHSRTEDRHPGIQAYSLHTFRALPPCPAELQLCWAHSSVPSPPPSGTLMPEGEGGSRQEEMGWGRSLSLLASEAVLGRLTSGACGLGTRVGLQVGCPSTWPGPESNEAVPLGSGWPGAGDTGSPAPSCVSPVPGAHLRDGPWGLRGWRAGAGVLCLSCFSLYGPGSQESFQEKPVW